MEDNIDILQSKHMRGLKAYINGSATFTNELWDKFFIEVINPLDKLLCEQIKSESQESYDKIAQIHEIFGCKVVSLSSLDIKSRKVGNSWRLHCKSAATAL